LDFKKLQTGTYFYQSGFNSKTKLLLVCQLKFKHQYRTTVL
jgi:hypothetical protein